LHWRSYGDHPLPSGPEALDEPLAAFPSWYLRIVCDRCGKERMVNEVHMPQRDLPISDILARARHDGCGGRAGKAELLTGIAAASSRPVRRIGVVLGVGGVLVWCETTSGIIVAVLATRTTQCCAAARLRRVLTRSA
jgi:hypothetical protein